jgi:hypothetical protein
MRVALMPDLESTNPEGRHSAPDNDGRNNAGCVARYEITNQLDSHQNSKTV